MQQSGDFGRDGHAATRQGENDGAFVFVSREGFGELLSCVRPILERHDYLFVVDFVRRVAQYQRRPRKYFG
ncbi:MAG TPA: hypothetical protein VME69_15390 [Methylocella sp.]|nr:hypothetical protein [Methylocella sp.]